MATPTSSANTLGGTPDGPAIRATTLALNLSEYLNRCSAYRPLLVMPAHGLPRAQATTSLTQGAVLALDCSSPLEQPLVLESPTCEARAAAIPDGALEALRLTHLGGEEGYRDVELALEASGGRYSDVRRVDWRPKEAWVQADRRVLLHLCSTSSITVYFEHFWDGTSSLTGSR